MSDSASKLDTDDRERLLWDLLSQLRSQGNPTDYLALYETVDWLYQQIGPLTVDDILLVNRSMGSHASDSMIPPTWLATFLVKLLQKRNATSFLDPFAWDGITAASLTSRLNLHRSDVVTPFSPAERIHKAANIEQPLLHLGYFHKLKQSLSSNYDAVVSFPFLNRKPESREYTLADKVLNITDDPSLLLILDASDVLAPNGVMIFPVSLSFWWRKRKNGVLGNLAAFDLHLSALLRVRSGTFTNIGIATELAVFERGPNSGLFVGEVPEDPGAQDEFLKRLTRRTRTGTVAQGIVVDPERYNGLEALQAQETVQGLVRNSGLIPTPFSNAIVELRVPKRSDNKFQHPPVDINAVYLPEVGQVDASQSLEGLPERFTRYIQLIVDPQVVLPGYLTAWLNTPLGRTVRATAEVGSLAPRVSRRALEQVTLYFPPLPEQTTALTALQKVLVLRSELNELESRVWSQPRKSQETFNQIVRVNHEDRFDDWVESLPFPLASILRSYLHVDQTDKDKYERLLHFFEALSLFLATIHLSACRASASIWANEQPKIKAAIQEQSLRFDMATFGLWRVVLSALVPTVRKLLNNPSLEQQRVCLDLYCVRDDAVLQILCSKKLLTLLEHANTHRNRWTGHGGSTSPTEATRRHEQLRNLLEEFRECVGVVFQRYELLELHEPQITRGQFKYRVRRIQGSNSTFEQGRIELSEPIDTGSLCFYSPGHNRALQLLQIFQILDAPQAACYFYNRSTKSTGYFVSYHIVSESEIERAVPDAVLNLLSEFAS